VIPASAIRENPTFCLGFFLIEHTGELH
jgi:hypothetical protein